MADDHSVERVATRVEGDGEEFLVTVTVDTGIYADGEVLFDWKEIPNAVRRKGDIGYVKSVTVFDKADQATGYSLFIASAGGALGTVNAVPSISDANALAGRIKHLGDIAAGNMKDLGGCRVGTKQDCALLVQAPAESRSLWIAGLVYGGTPTFGAATDVVLLVDIMWK